MAKRGYGTGQLYVKHGAYYGRWRTLDGRKLNRRIGRVGTGGITRAEAERQFRKLHEAWVRGEYSGEGESDLSTRRSVPMVDRLARKLDRWSQRTLYGADDDLVLAHPQSGRPLDRTKLTRRFKAACVEAGVRPVRFHDLRHTFATRLAASGLQPMRTIQEFLGHADSKTTQIYAHYAPSAHEVEMINTAFAEDVKQAEEAATP